MSRTRGRLARAILVVASRLVPGHSRAEWRAEWEAELWAALERPNGAPAAFAIGGLRHAVYMRRREWSADLLASDLRQAVRSLVRARVFSLVAIATLALGIGVNAAIFNLVNALLFRPPPGMDTPATLVQVGRGATPDDFDSWSYPYFTDLQQQTYGIFDGLAAWAGASVVIGEGADGIAAAAQVVSGNYFDVLGVRPLVGRLLRPDDDGAPGDRAVVVLSEGFWRATLGGDPAIVGRDLPINGRPFEVIGVAGGGFGGADIFRPQPAVWAPLSMQSVLTGRATDRLLHRGNSWLSLVGRLSPGLSPEGAQAAAQAVSGRIAAGSPDFAAEGLLVIPGVGLSPQDREVGARVGGLLMAVSALVLIVACANLAGLGLARGAARQGEMGVRAVLGARPGRLARQVLIESILVSLPGAALAFLLTVLLASTTSRVLPVPVSVHFEPDLRVLAFTLAVGMVAGAVSGLPPARRGARADLAATLRTSAVGRGTSARTERLRRTLVVAQLAFCFVLLAAATLLVRSMRNAYAAEPGFRTRGVQVVSLDLIRGGPAEPQARAALKHAIAARIAVIPGVDAVGAATVLPVVDPQPNRTPLPPGALPSRDRPAPAPVYQNTVDAGYFEVLGLRPIAGRLFDAAGEDGDVVIVNERLAARFFPQGDAVGAVLPFAMDRGATPVIIGVVPDAAVRALGETPPAVVYSPLTAARTGQFDLLVAGNLQAAALQRAIRDAVRAVDPRLPVLRSAPLDRLVGGSLAQTRLTSSVVGFAGILALVLAAIGVHGVVACAVEERRREFGLRLALGSRPAGILRLVLRQGLLLAALGTAIGAAVAIPALTMLEALLFGVSPRDPATFAVIALLLGTATLTATAIPAARAIRTDPARTLSDA